MEIIPVIDVMGGKAVSGKCGERNTYKEIKTVFAGSANPLEIAKNIPGKRLYVADLDGIMKNRPDLRMLEELSRVKKVMADTGIRSYEDFKKISHLDLEVVIGTETLQDLKFLKRVAENKNVILSIDVKERKVVSKFLPERIEDAFKVLKSRGIKRFILLDISSVGTLSGFRLDLEKILSEDVELYVGGGVRKEDIKKLEKKGVTGTLVGTSLHEGKFSL